MQRTAHRPARVGAGLYRVIAINACDFSASNLAELFGEGREMYTIVTLHTFTLSQTVVIRSFERQ